MKQDEKTPCENCVNLLTENSKLCEQIFEMQRTIDALSNRLASSVSNESYFRDECQKLNNKIWEIERNTGRFNEKESENKRIRELELTIVKMAGMLK